MIYLFIFIIIIVFVIFLITKGVQGLLKNNSAPADIENLTPFLCSVSKYRKKDGKLIKGDSNIVFDDNLFIIRQNNETIENEIESIYYFDIWEYKDETYFKFRMRSNTEYIFKSVHFESDKIATYLKSKGIKIEDNRESN